MKIIKTTDFFGATIDELLKLDELGGTVEEDFLFGHGENVAYFDDLKEYEEEKKDFEQWMCEHEYDVKEVFETINGRLAFVLVKYNYNIHTGGIDVE